MTYPPAHKKFASGAAIAGHTRLASAVSYLGIAVDDVLEMAEQTDA